MSAEQNPIMIPVFLAGILAYALAKEGCEVIGKVGTNLCNETKAFVEEGSKLGKNALKDLTLGSIENLVHGVEDGGTIFNAMVGGVEIAFQRCGKAIVGTIANNENEYISEEIAENISKSYQNIISEI
ncbi:MAG TPA: hypothetical protein QF644_04445, partial [Candidatus Poseidoniaceae archaeon]|nr:hypothetical protein [Candidatus Poseidoniaceae archaeon]